MNDKFAAARLENFVDVSELYRSSTGAVYKARFKFDGRWYVLKERRLAELGGNRANRRRLMMNEVDLLRQLSHPNVVRCEGWFWDETKKGPDDCSLFIVLEYLSGGDLSNKISERRRQKRPFSENHVWFLFNQICAAVCHLHENGIIHRDLKALNVIMNSSGRIVKVADLGVSRQVSEETIMLKSFYGTPLYLSPELVNNAAYNEKTDIWSLGIILYELAALRPPFQAKNLIALAESIRSGEFDPLPPMYSREMERVVRWLLQVDQKKRPSISQVLKEVQKRLPSGYYGAEDQQDGPRVVSSADSDTEDEDGLVVDDGEKKGLSIPLPPQQVQPPPAPAQQRPEVLKYLKESTKEGAKEEDGRRKVDRVVPAAFPVILQPQPEPQPQPHIEAQAPSSSSMVLRSAATEPSKQSHSSSAAPGSSKGPVVEKPIPTNREEKIKRDSKPTIERDRDRNSFDEPCRLMAQEKERDAVQGRIHQKGGNERDRGKSEGLLVEDRASNSKAMNDDSAFTIVDSQRLQAALKRELLQMKRLQQLVILTEQKVVGGRDVDELKVADGKGSAVRERMEQTAAAIAVLQKAMVSGKLEIALAIKLGE